MRFLQYGAGNIGRSFTGALFAQAGYEVIFVDVNPQIIEALNRDNRYKVLIKDKPGGEFWVEGVRAVDGKDIEAVSDEIAQADLMATSVGARWLPQIYPNIARGLIKRLNAGTKPLDIIIAENLRYATTAFTKGIKENLPADFPFRDYVGLIETSIGKMVPIMPEEIVKEDPTLVFAEAYNTLILDKKAFKNPIPDVSGLDPKDNIDAYVDRKLFIHNLGHATCAYLGHLQNPELTYIWEVMEDTVLKDAVEGTMMEAATALMLRYPAEFNEENQAEHIKDLLKRFSNKALGDTIFRVGRDLTRKLAREDRLIGALLMCASLGVTTTTITRATAAAFFFDAKDENGNTLPSDEGLLASAKTQKLEEILQNVCGLDIKKPLEAKIIQSIKDAYDVICRKLAEGKKPI